MDPKRGYSSSRAAQSSSDSSGGSDPASPASPAPARAPGGGAGGGSSKLAAGGNTFANDGSFMEMFKRKMEAEERRKKEGGGDTHTAAEEGQSTQDKKPLAVTSFVGKRRGGAKLALKTGMVAKKQKPDEKEAGKSDAWSTYMAEVKKYKAHQCGDDDKTRPLVK